MTTGDSNAKLHTLGKILQLERKGEFQDRAVRGGLDLFLQRWQGELQPVLGAVSMSYADMTVAQRRQWVGEILARIEGASDASSVASTTPPAPQSPQSAKPQTKPPRRSGTKIPNSPAPISLNDDVSNLKAVTAKVKPRLNRLGIKSVEDLIYHFPYRHDDFTNIRNISQLIPGKTQTVIATVWEVRETGRGRMKSAQAILGDETGNIRATWFNQAYLKNILTPGTQIVISGMAKVYRQQIVFQSPEYDILTGQEEVVHAGRLVPVYALTDGLYQRTLRRCVKEALDRSLSQVQEYAPSDMLRRCNLMPLGRAIWQMHYPDSQGDWEAARRRLAFDELMMLQLTVAGRKVEWQASGGAVALRSDGTLNAFLDSLPYSLTNAQRRSLDEILQDMSRSVPMSRLLQGDVGSGKTVVATAALLTAALNGYQAALMAPTEILAEQHFLTVCRMLAGDSDVLSSEIYVSIQIPSHPKSITVGLLVGSLVKRAKDEMHRRIADGDVDIVIGTQALIQSSVDIPNLALVVVDEQHRFGVMQRNTLRAKGDPPHMLAMSATPIPRSLALTLYGDLDLSTIDELPPGRHEIRTRWVEPDGRTAAYGFIRKEVDAGRQAFIICPLIEESEAIQARAATEEYERLSTQVFPSLRLGLLHGRMSLNEKEDVMQQFQNGEIDILVSTPVIEVGIDVPNASVMMIDGADRFGLAQLHQFRGRVGRGEQQSYCLLLSDSPGMEARERMRIVERVSDGFQLAEEDLRIRGPGEYMGTRQSGLPDLKAARITDQDILLMARKEALRLVEDDPHLHREENRGIARRFQAYTAGFSGGMS